MKFPPTISQDYENNLENMCNQFSISSNVNKFFHTPYFKRYFNSKDVTEMVAFYEVQNYIKNIISIDAIWNDIGFDYFQQYHFVIETSVLSHFNNSILKKWMSENLSHRTFLNMLSVYYSKVGYCVYQTNIADTFSQLVSLLDGGYEFSIPNRWRFVEFHDHISYLYLKKDIKNVEHKNEFISIPFTKDKWKVYQPKDTLELAKHPNTPVEILKVIATDEHYYVRHWVAKHPNTSVETLKVLATDKDYDIRCGVAKNPNTPTETLKVLATDGDWNVRYGVAQNPNTPVETLNVLATDEHYYVRYGVARNPNTPVEIHKLIRAYEFIMTLKDT